MSDLSLESSMMVRVTVGRAAFVLSDAPVEGNERESGRRVK